MALHTTADKVNDRQQAVSGNGPSLKNRYRTIQWNLLFGDNQHHYIQCQHGSKTSIRSKIEVTLRELWQIKNKIYHFRGYEVKTHVLGLLK
jgi:hypothetical protein